MGIVARLRRGKNILDLSSGHYALMPGFQPPTAQELVNMSSGTSANKTGGSSAVGKFGTNYEWSFQVRVMGSKVKELDRQVETLDYFLRQAGNDADPLYFEFRSETDFSFEPVWGQYGVFKKLEVVQGASSKTNLYSAANIRDKAQIVDVMLEVKPYILGQRQLVGKAVGSVVEDTIGKADGMSRGVMFCPDTTNKMTNPVFGHATWNNGWTASDVTLVTYCNYDKRYWLFEGRSACLMNTTASTVRNYYQAINVGGTSNHTLSFYVKKIDGSAVTSNDCVAYYGSAQTTTFVSAGNGWYRAQATMAGVNAATNTGVQVKGKKTIYVDAFQIEQAAAAKPFLYGEMLGCSWSGTAHASTSSANTGGHMHMPSPNESGLFGHLESGTIQVVWKADHDANAFGVNEYIFHDASGLYLRYTTASTDWTFSDGTNSVTSSGKSFSNGDVIIFHCLYDSSGLELYVDGSSVGTNATYAQNGTVASSGFVIGADSAGANQIKGTIMGFTTYDRRFSSSEVAAAYASVYQIASDDVRVDGCPWAWTNDGDYVLDFYNDATHFDYLIAGGIPGSAPADTIFDVTTSNGRSLIISNNTNDSLVDQLDLMNDQSGTAATAVGSAVYQISLDTTEAIFQTTTTTVNFNGILGKKVYLFMSMGDSSGGDYIYCRPSYTIGDTTAKGEYQSCPATTVLCSFLVGPITVTKDDISRFDWIYNGTMTFAVYGLRTEGTAANMQVDFVRALPGATAYIYNPTTNGERIIVQGRGAYCYNGTDFNGFLGVRGDVVELEPYKYNHVVMISGDLEAANTYSTFTSTVNNIFVLPRYHLL